MNPVVLDNANPADTGDGRDIGMYPGTVDALI